MEDQMATPQPERTKLSTDEAREMRNLSNELQQVLNKIAKIVGSGTGADATSYTVATVIMKSGSNPLQIGFDNSKIREVQPGAVNKDEADEIGYYIDPPGVCTTVPACIPE
jgi:hypothetical protein